MKLLAFAGSSSKKSINKQLVKYVSTLFEGFEVELLDLNDFEAPLISVDKLDEEGIPQVIQEFSKKIDAADMILLSLAEHNGAYSTAFKNLFDWLSLMKDRSVFQDKPIFLMSTSPGSRGGASVMEIAKNRFPFNGGNIIETFSLPSFGETFEDGKGIINETFKEELLNKIKLILQDLD